MRQIALPLLFGIWLAAAAQDREAYYPHFTMTPGVWETEVSFANPATVSATVTLIAWGVDGTPLGETELLLEPGQGLAAPVETLFDGGLPAERGWLEVHCNRENLRGLLTFRHVPQQGTSSLNLVQTAGTDLLMPLLETSQERTSGFVVTNVSDQTATVELTLIDLETGATQTAQRALTAKAKLTALLTDVFAEPLPAKAALSAAANQPLAGFALTFQNGVEQIIAVPGEVWNPAGLQALKAAVQDAFNGQGLVGANVGLHLAGQDPIVVSLGEADKETGAAMKPHFPMEAGSITKTFTAALILQLWEEGALSLDDAIDAWLPQIPNAESITIRMALNHSSGIANYTGTQSFLDRIAALLNGSGSPIAPLEMIEMARTVPYSFEPGASYEYSNTNYIALGLIVEAVTGDAYVRQLRSRLLDPLELRHSFLAGSEPVAYRARGYLYQGSAVFTDVTDTLDLSWAWAAGALVSTPEDLMAWARALYRGDALSQEARDAMLEPSPNQPGYGLGVTFVPYQTQTMIGHDGATYGGLAYMAYLPDSDLAICVMQNSRNMGAQLSGMIFAALNVAVPPSKRQARPLWTPGIDAAPRLNALGQ